MFMRRSSARWASSLGKNESDSSTPFTHSGATAAGVHAHDAAETVPDQARGLQPECGGECGSLRPFPPRCTRSGMGGAAVTAEVVVRDAEVARECVGEAGNTHTARLLVTA